MDITISVGHQCLGGTASVSRGAEHSITFRAVLREFVVSNQPGESNQLVESNQLLHSVTIFISRSRCTKKFDGVILARRIKKNIGPAFCSTVAQAEGKLQARPIYCTGVGVKVGKFVVSSYSAYFASCKSRSRNVAWIKLGKSDQRPSFELVAFSI
jgi:hypothetical protein